MILVATALGALVFGLVKNAWLAYYAAAVVAICLLIFQRLVTARFRSSNWLIRMTDHGLFVKFRSISIITFPIKTLRLYCFPTPRSAR
jgi:hypothetical protein